MKKQLILLLTVSALLIGCSSNIESSSSEQSNPSISYTSNLDSNSDEPISSSIDRSSSEEEEEEIIPPEKENHYRLNLSAILLKDKNNNPINLIYDIPNEYFSFDHSSTTFKKELALAALEFVNHAPFIDQIKETYDYYSFDNLVFSDEYEEEETDETLLYVIGHKKVNGYDLINLSIAGYNYQKPWGNNFNLGETGYHTGFNNSAMKLLPTVMNYLKQYEGESNVKLFINGYSRSAAIAERLAILLIDNKIIDEEHLYAYLFETPHGIDANNTNEYKSIFNIINSADLVTYVAPEKYGFKRAGIEIDLYKNNADELLQLFNKKLKLNAFASNNNYADDVEFINYFLDYLLKPIEDEEESKDISTRENFANNLQDDISYLLPFIFGLPQKVLDIISDSFDELKTVEKTDLLKEDGIYNFLVPILVENDVLYDAIMLKEVTNDLIKFIQQKPMFVTWAVSKNFINNLMRTIYFHTLETVLPLLVNL